MPGLIVAPQPEAGAEVLARAGSAVDAVRRRCPATARWVGRAPAPGRGHEARDDRQEAWPVPFTGPAS